MNYLIVPTPGEKKKNQKWTVMVNFMCHLDWVTGYPDIWLNIIQDIKKNTFESVLMRWMKLEPIIQSEVSRKEKHQCSILTHIYGI